MQSSDPGEVIRRDFAQLSVPATDRWLPPTRAQERRAGPSRLRTVMVFAAALIVGVGIGQEIQQQRSDDAGPAAAATPTNVRLTREEGEARVRALTGIVVRLERLESKLVTRTDLDRAGLMMAGAGDSRGAWIVAAAGELRPAFGASTKTFPWMLFVVDADSGAILTTHAGEAGAWPSLWERIPERCCSPS
jgi:hypothetical protein